MALVTGFQPATSSMMLSAKRRKLLNVTTTPVTTTLPQNGTSVQPTGSFQCCIPGQYTTCDPNGDVTWVYDFKGNLLTAQQAAVAAESDSITDSCAGQATLAAITPTINSTAQVIAPVLQNAGEAILQP